MELSINNALSQEENDEKDEFDEISGEGSQITFFSRYDKLK
jgi:hypothetical protein